MTYVLSPGTANLNQATRVIAGSYSTVTYIYTTGHPIDDGGHIKIAFRYAGDFAVPQFAHPEEDNFCSIETTGDCMFLPSWRDLSYTNPWGKELILEIANGFLRSGDTVTLTFGDRSGGSRGWQVQTFVEKTFAFKTFVDPMATHQYKRLPESPTMNVAPGRPVKAICLAPSIMQKNQEIAFYLKLEDRWGNPAAPIERIVHPGFPEEGNFAIEIGDEKTGLEAASNPILITETKPKMHFYWADFSGQSEETCGSNSIEQYFDFGRDFAVLDILGHQGNDFMMTDSTWQAVKNAADSHNFRTAGEFVTFPGFEWSGNTLVGGDRNVFFSSTNCNITRSSRDMLPDYESIHFDSPTVEHLFNNLKTQSVNAFTIANVGGRYANMDMHDPEVEVGVEIHSSAGTFEWLLADALKTGCRVGICANSADHKGRPGASYPGASKYDSYGGLTCVLSRSLSRRDIFYSMKKRHFYATTGNRAIIDMKLEINDKTHYMMGDELQLREDDVAKLYVQVVGTAPVESINLLNGMQDMLIQRAYGAEDLGRRVKIIWSGAEERGHHRGVDWSGRLIVRDNNILNVTPVNFWNPDLQPFISEDNVVNWESYTTGGLAGVILELEDANAGSIRMETAQGNLEFSLSMIGYDPRTFDFEGLDKKISIYQLPDELFETNFDFKIELSTLHKGCNPVYIKMIQEDGHMAWTSPVYIDV